MSVTHYKRIIHLLDYSCGFLTVLPALFLALSCLSHLSAAWLLLFPAAAVLLSFLLQEFCQTFFVFAAGSLTCLLAALPAAFWAGFPKFTEINLSQFLVLLIFLVFSLLLTILNFVWRLRPRKEIRRKGMSIAYLILPVLSQVTALKIDLRESIPYILISSVCLLLLLLLREYLSGYTLFLEEVKNSVKVPLGQIVSSNGWLLAAFFLLATFAMIIICLLPLGNPLPAIASGIIEVFRFFVWLFLRLFSGKEGGSSSPTPSAQQPDLSEFGESEASPFWEILGTILQFVLLAVIIIGGIALVLYAIFQIIKAFYSSRTLANDRIEFLNPFDKKEKLTQTDTLGTKPNLFRRIFGSTPEQRIRKSWYKTVSHRMPDVTANLAPLEIAKNLGRGENEQKAAKELSNFYEKARYSNHACTKEEAASAKQLAGKLK